MIKINLTKNRSDTAVGTSAEYETTFDTSFGEEGQGASPVGVLLKILMCVAGVAGLWGYESYNIGNLRGELKEVTARVSALNKQIEEKRDVQQRAEELQLESKALRVRIDAINELSKSRLRELRAMDFLQNVLPEKVWLNRIIFDGDTLLLFGGAMADEDLNRFFSNIDNKSMFVDVYIRSAVEQKTTQATFKVFEISSRLAAK